MNAVHCTFDEENISDLTEKSNDKFSFGFFDNLRTLVIKKKAIKSDWTAIVNGIVLIPNPNFKKLVI